MTTEMVRVTPEWLELREPADATARSIALVERLIEHLPTARPLVIHDLGCGTGSMTRWLAPLLPGPQHWVLHDRDASLLEGLTVTIPGRADVTVETRVSDITRLPADGLRGAHLVTASALLDMFAADDLARFTDICLRAGCPSLLTLSVTGRVELAPYHPLDDRVRDAFNDHQRRTVDGRRLLGPDAVGVAGDRFRSAGATAVAAPSPWHLESHQRDLLTSWLTGWVSAAVEQDPSLGREAAAYLSDRLAAISEGRVAATIPHADLLVLPR